MRLLWNNTSPPPEAHVTHHARVRYRERINGDATDDEIENVLLAHPVQMAMAAGACKISLNGISVVLDGCKVVTVYPAKHYQGRGPNYDRY